MACLCLCPHFGGGLCAFSSLRVKRTRYLFIIIFYFPCLTSLRRHCLYLLCLGPALALTNSISTVSCLPFILRDALFIARFSSLYCSALVYLCFNCLAINSSSIPSKRKEIATKKRCSETPMFFLNKFLFAQEILRGKEGFYYVNFFDKKNKHIYDGFSYLQMDKENKPLYFYEANDASYRASQREWLLTKVRIISFSPELQISSVESKESLSLALPEKPDFFEKVSYFPSELGIDELYKEIQKSTAQGTDALEYTIEFHTRLVFPMSCSLLCFIGLIGGTSTKRRTGSSFTQALLLSTFIILVYYVSFTISRSLALSRTINPALTAWLPIGIYIPIMVYFIRK